LAFGVHFYSCSLREKVLKVSRANGFVLMM